MPDVRLMTVDPGHFHAALVQKEMYPGVAPRVDVYAPLGSDLYEHLKRIDSFNRRSERPTTWETEVHAGPDFFERMLREHPGNVVVLSGRNRGKIDRIVASVEAGLNVLADKPWILKSDDLPKVEQALAEADKRGVVAYDIMTERFEVTTILQRALVNDRSTFGEIVQGTEAEPGRLHGERPQPDEGRRRRAEHPSGVVLRHGRAGRRDSTTSARISWIWCSGRSFPIRRSTTGRTSECWPRSAGRHGSRSRLSARDQAKPHFPERAVEGHRPSSTDADTRSSTTATRSSPTRCAASTRS